jgi:DNA-binding CsgD family transcriptional regulator
MKSVKGLARHLGIHPNTVRKHLKAQGVAIVQPGLISPEQLTLAIELYEAGQSSIVIGKRLGFDSHTIIGALRKSGVKIRAQLGRS